MEVVRGNPDARAVGGAQLPGTANYFIGNDPSQWHTNIPTFGRVGYQDVYPGIDLAYYGNNGALEYDFIVSPGADPNVIALTFAGAESVEVNPQGDLVLHTAAGDMVQQKPYLYQESNGVRTDVAGSFVLSNQYSVLGTQHSALVTFEVGAYDPTRALVIDPLVLGYSTYLGSFGGGEGGAGIGIDASGNAYMTGITASAKFPTTPGAFDTTNSGNDAFVAKLNPFGSALVYATYLGGTGADYGRGIAVGDGSAYVIGLTESTNFPTTPGAFDTTPGFGWVSFVAKLTTGTALAYASFLGTGESTNLYGAQGIAVDVDGHAHVTGFTDASTFPTTPGAFDTTYNGAPGDVFVTKFNVQGSALEYSTFLGGSSYDSGGDEIAIDVNGAAYVTGHTQSANFPTTPGAFDTIFNGLSDVFVTKLNVTGSALAYSTFLGGNNYDDGYGITVDGRGHAYVSGGTGSIDFPTTPGAFDTTWNTGFVTKLSVDGSALVYSTFLGGSQINQLRAVVVDGAGNAYVTGYTSSIDFPMTPRSFDPVYNGGTSDSFLTKLDPAGSTLIDSTFLGGNDRDFGHGIAVDDHGNAYVTGTTESTTFPTTPGVLKRRIRFASNVFVTKFTDM